MQISYQIQNQDKWHVKTISGEALVVGRPNNKTQVQIDLSPDTTVSRLHARIWFEEGVCWLEDLESSSGTKVNGSKISGRLQLMDGDSVLIGETILKVGTSDGTRAWQAKRSPGESTIKEIDDEDEVD